jgi:hypothetical protein
MHLDSRILSHESSYQRAELEGEQRCGAAHSHDAARLRAYFGNDPLSSLGFNQHRDTPVIELTPDFCDREAPRRAVKEAHAKAFLKCQDTTAEFRLLDSERSPGSRKAAMLDHSGEKVEIIEVVHRPIDRTVC